MNQVVNDIMLTKEQQLYYLAHLIAMAIEKYGFTISPCAKNKSFKECLNVVNNKVILWFNLPSGTTSVTQLPLNQ